MSNPMTSRERVRATVRGLPVDRVPVFYWINAHTGARLMTDYRPSRFPAWNVAARWMWRRFVRQGGMNAPELARWLPLAFDIHTFNWANMYAVDLGADMFFAAHATPWWYTKIYREHGHARFKDMFGVVRAVGGIYPDVIEPVIQSREAMNNYVLPDNRSDKLYGMFRSARKKFPETFIAAEIWGPQDFTATSMFNMERFMLFLMDYPEDMHRFLARWTDWWIEVIRRCVAAGADAILIEDDYGYDHRTLISMSMWREFTYPYLRRLIDAGHEAGALVILHSCGYQMPFLPYYVDAGLDMLQSFQPQAGNDFPAAHAEFGDRLTFITGIDTQRGETLTPSALRAEILANHALTRPRGHLILGTTHEIQFTMPAANVRAIFDTVREIQDGRFDG
jgi:uroporphyrinogen decarboxylase